MLEGKKMKARNMPKSQSNKISRYNNQFPGEKITKSNIMDYFVFDEDENNLITDNSDNQYKKEIKNETETEENKNNQIKVEYNVNTFITSSYRPDLYSPYGVISGNKYKLKFGQNNNIKQEEEEENEEEEKTAKKEEDKESSSLSNDKDINCEIKKLKLGRYFNLENDISIKCYICGQIGHKKDNCPNFDIKFCYRCLSDSHEDRECPKVKCFKCNKLGHKTMNCKVKEENLIICERCNCIGHKKNECLIDPMEYSHKFLKRNNLSCLYCGSNKHVLCPLGEREIPIILDDEIDDDDFSENNNDNNSDMSSLTPKSVDEDEIKNKKKEEKKIKKKIKKKKKKK